jgi:glycosyltransferase involved in cell wall biosynthesis
MASEHKITVSIILPTYNRVDVLPRAVESVLAQSFSDYELIIINDASTDGTREYLDALAKKDARVHSMHHEKNYYPDISRTLNEGIARARGKYIARIDDDDFWVDKDKLRKQVAFLEKNPDCAVIGSGMVLVDPSGKEIGRYLKKETDAEIRETALFANPFSHTTVLFRADIAQRVGGYGEWRYAEDWDFWLKMGVIGTLHNLPEYCAAYTVSGENKSFVYLRPQTKMIFEFLRVHKHEYPGYAKAYMINLLQYCYSFLPVGFRRYFQSVLANLKRRLF